MRERYPIIERYSEMPKCAICEVDITQGRYPFCRECYRRYPKHTPWVEYLRKLEYRRRKAQWQREHKGEYVESFSTLSASEIQSATKIA